MSDSRDRSISCGRSYTPNDTSSVESQLAAERIGEEADQACEEERTRLDRRMIGDGVASGSSPTRQSIIDQLANVDPALEMVKVIVEAPTWC